MIACGLSHTALITNGGILYCMGSNISGQLGIGDSSVEKLNNAIMVEALSMWEAKKISCSENSTFCLMESGELFSWGSCEHGILGIGDIEENQQFPIKVVLEDNQDAQIVDISAGRNHAAIIVAASEEESYRKTTLYTWGQNYSGQLGTWDYENRSTP